jgi:hypothetical protein
MGVSRKGAARFALAALMAVAAQPAASAWRLESVALGFDAAQLTNARGLEDRALTMPLSLGFANGAWRAGFRGGVLRYGRRDTPGAPRSAVTGLADTSASLTYTVLAPRWNALALTLGGFAKLPSARAQIGTGKIDAGLQVEVSFYTRRLIPFAAASYRVNGRIEGQSMRNSLQAHIGAQTIVTPAVALGAYALYRQSAFKTVRDYRDLVVFASVALGRQWSLQGYGTAAIGPRAGDLGGGVQLRYRFAVR